MLKKIFIKTIKDILLLYNNNKMAIYPPPTESLPIFDSSVFVNALVEESSSTTTTSTTARLVIKQLGGFTSGNTTTNVEAIQEENVPNVTFLNNLTTAVKWNNCIYTTFTELIPVGNYLVTGQINLNYNQGYYNISGVDVEYGLSNAPTGILTSSTAGGLKLSPNTSVVNQPFQFSFSKVIYIDGTTAYDEFQIYITAYTMEFGTVAEAYGNDGVQELTLTKIS